MGRVRGELFSNHATPPQVFCFCGCSRCVPTVPCGVGRPGQQKHRPRVFKLKPISNIPFPPSTL